ncbi:MAG: hypothetical protein ACI4ST_06270 [Candidatus Gallimonas sp.]
MKKRTVCVAVCAVMLCGSVGCSTIPKEKIPISVGLWDKSMCSQLTPWLEEEFPEVEFTFVVGYNTIDFYDDLAQRGALPDVISCRRFSLNDAAHMSDKLLDVGRTNVAGSFYESYIENNREPDGAVRWLPMCAEVDGYIANLDLFQQYNVALPQNYEQFRQVCNLFEENGVMCYVNDYDNDYSCLEALQGCAIPDLVSVAGIEWRKQYESETVDGEVELDDTVWPEVFRKFEQYVTDTHLNPEDADTEFATMKSAFLGGEAAIIRGASSNCVSLRKDSGMNCVMLPYFGETNADNWLMTYPSCQIAVNADVAKNAAKHKKVMEVLDKMFSGEGQLKVSSGNAVLSYSKNVDVAMNDVFGEVRDCINGNRLYMRLASTEMFSVSKTVVHKMIKGEYDGAAEAYADFNRLLTSVSESQTEETVTTQQTEYSYAFSKHGSPAASAVMNTLRRQWGSDVAIGYSSVITSSVFAGDYNERQLSWLIANKALIREGELTGGELIALMQWLINENPEGNNPIRHFNLIPVTSGMSYTLTARKDGSYVLGGIEINGEAVDADKVYSVMTLGDNSFITAAIYCNCPMPSALDGQNYEEGKLKVNNSKTAATVLKEALEGGNQFEEPTVYVTVVR